MAKKVAGIVVTALLLAYSLTLILHISANQDQYLWDFRTHREAGKILAAGSNPYDAANLFPKARTRFLYTYPPATLFFYRLFAIPAYKTAFQIFLISKFLLLIGLIYFWQRQFFKKDGGPLFYLFCLLAFNSAVFLDMIAGNINVVQQALLWLGFSFFINGRLKLFCFFTLIAASFKMTPIFFLILLLLSDQKDKYKYFFGAGAVFLAYLLIQYMIEPDLFTGFIKNALEVVGERGGVAPSTGKMVAAIFESIAKMTGLALPRAFESVVFGIIAAAVIFFSYQACLRLKRAKIENRATLEVFVVCLVYALIHPRFKDYGYILLLVPSYYIIKNIRYTRIAPFLFLLFILSDRMMLPIAASIYDIIWAYYPLLVAYCVWGIYLHEIFSPAQEPAVKPPAGR
jgi:Glycosyltransferase family 87